MSSLWKREFKLEPYPALIFAPFVNMGSTTFEEGSVSRIDACHAGLFGYSNLSHSTTDVD